MRALLVLLLLAGTAAADGSAAGPPAGGGRPAPRQGPNGNVKIVGQQRYDETSLTLDDVIKRVRTVYMAGVKRCYAEALKRDPEARGSMVLRFTVTAKGHTSNVITHGFNEKLADCIRDLELGWSFAIPKDRDAKATEATFALDLAFE